MNCPRPVRQLHGRRHKPSYNAIHSLNGHRYSAASLEPFTQRATSRLNTVIARGLSRSKLSQGLCRISVLSMDHHNNIYLSIDVAGRRVTQENETESREVAMTRLESDNASPRLLIAEDEPDLRELLTDSFMFRGYHCTAMSDGALALHCLHGEQFDLVIADTKCPRWTAFSCLSAYRNSRTMIGLP